MPTVKAQVIEGMTGDPLQNASITVVDQQGNNLHQGVIADSTGKFAFTSDLLTGNYLLVSYTGMKSVIIATSLLNDREYKEIDLFPAEMQAVVVTPANNKKDGDNWWWLVVLGVIGGMVILSKNKKKKKYAGG